MNKSCGKLYNELKIINKHILTLLSILFFTINIVSQNVTIDSLQNVLQKQTSKDSNRVNTLNELAYSLHRLDVTKAVGYIDESALIAQEIGYKKGKAKSIYVRGILSVMQSEFDFALQYIDSASAIYNSIGEKSELGGCYNVKGIIYSYRGDYESSLEYYDKAMQVDEEIGLEKNIPKYLINMGDIKMQTGDYSDALFYFNKALVRFQKMNHSQGVANCLTNIGIVYHKQGNYVLAVEYANKSLMISEEMQDSTGISGSLNNLGIVYHEQEKNDKALECYQKSLAIQESFNNQVAVASLKNNIATIYIAEAEYDKAIVLLEEAISLIKEINNKPQLPNSLNNLGNIYLTLKDYEKAYKYYIEAKEIAGEMDDYYAVCSSSLGISKVHLRQGESNKSLENALLGHELSITYGFLNYQRDASQLLSEIYEKKGDFKNAFTSHKEYKELNDSLFNKKSIEKITQLEYEYKYKQELESGKDREVKLNQKVKSTNKDLRESQQSFLMGVIVFLTVVLVLVAVIFFMKLRNAKSKNQTILIEQKLLRLQMTPHFMFNALSVLQGMILSKEDTKAVKYLSKFSRLLRITLENSRDKMVPLNQELTAVENYLELQNIEENESYKYTVVIDDKIDQSLFEVPPMLIQPFIENAIEHGFENIKENRIIDVRLNFVDQQLICVITDNGVGVNTIKQTKNKQKKSLATNITAERLSLISKNYKIKGSIKIEDRQAYKEQGTIVTVVMPYIINDAR